MQVIVDKHTVTIIKNEIVNEGEYNVQSCNFQFSSDYDGLPKIAIFKTGTVTKQIMLSGNTCITPEEVLQTTGIVGLGVYAYQTDGDNLTLRYSPTPAVFTVEPGSYDEGDTPTPPIPSVIEQLQEEITQNANNITSLENVTATHTTQIGTLQTDVNNIKTEQITQNTNISKNADDIATLNNNLTNYSLITETGSQIVLNVNPSNYQMTAILKDKNGNTIYTSNVIDLPIESMIVNVTYDSTTKEIVFTLQNGTTLRVSVADLVSGLVSTDELNTILASYYTKAEIDTLLSGKVDTTTYTQGQAAQDTNIQNNTDSIEDIESLIEQMPTVSGQGTDLSLENVLNYRLMKFLPQGVSSQDGEPTPTTPIPVKSVTGENSLVISNVNLFDVNDITRGYELQPDGRINVKPDWYVSDYIKVTPNTHYYLSGTKTSGQTNNFYDIDKNIISYVNKLTGLLTTPSDCYYVRFNGLLTQLSDISFVKGSTAPTTYVEHEEQNYSLSLGNIELNSSPDGTIRDEIYGSPNNWYKREYIGKVVLDGSENLKIADNVLYFNVSSYFKIINPNTNNAYCNYFIYGGTAYNTSNAYSKGNNRFTMNRDGSRIYIRNDELLDLNSWKAWLNTHNTEFYYALETPTDIPITDTTLINQLNNIYNNAHSYNGVTNITTTYESGNEQMYLDIEALAKGGSSTAETDPTVPSYVKGITQQNITDWNDKQDELVSGTNIKTINNESLLGSGNITIQGGGSSYTAGTNIEITNENVINNKIPFEGTSGNGFVVGQKKTNTTINTSAIGIGKNITASGLQTVVIGNNATGSNQMSVAIGEYATVDSEAGVAIGRSAEIHGNNSIAIGNGATTYQRSSIALGKDANARQSNLFQIGSSTYPINKAQITTSTGDKELATQDYVDTAIATAITSALGGSY